MLSGKAYYAKIVGKPKPGYDKTQLEWSMDVAVTPETRKALIKQGVGDYVKNKGDDRGDFITFKRKAMKSDGTPAKPIKVVDNKGQPWNQETFIGNTSTVNVNYALNEKAAGGLKPGLIAVQVWEHVPYVPAGGEDEFPVAAGDDEDWSAEA